MNDGMTLHLGRAWSGHAAEDSCPCPKAPCGLAVPEGQEPGSCDQHNPADPIHAHTMRQVHMADQCPGPQDHAQRPQTTQEALEDVATAFRPLRDALAAPLVHVLDWTAKRLQAWDRALKRRSRR